MKPLNAFGSRKERASGVRSRCRQCERELCADYRLAHKDKVRDARRKAYDSDPSKFRAYSAAYRQRNSEKVSAELRRYREENQEKLRAEARERYARDPVRALAVKARWRHNNADRMKAARTARKNANPEKARQKSVTDSRRHRATIKGRLENAIRVAVYMEIVKGSKVGRATFSLLGYTPDDLKRHLERQFTEGMSWDNYGRDGWHIDHRIPLSAFNYETPDHIDFKRAWSLSNLQPMWARENKSKNAKLSAPFQPSLALG